MFERNGMHIHRRGDGFECVVKDRRVILGLLLTVASTGNK